MLNKRQLTRLGIIYTIVGEMKCNNFSNTCVRIKCLMPQILFCGDERTKADKP
jgi:hypothetical protein